MCTSSLRQEGNGIGHPFAKVLLLSPSHVFLSGPCGPVEWLLHDSSRIALLGDSREVDGRFVQLALWPWIARLISALHTLATQGDEKMACASQSGSV